MRFSKDDRAVIADAIRKAEQTTSGEIFCVFARRVSAYKDISLAWAAAAALLLPLGLIPLGFEPALVPGLNQTWEAGHSAARDATVGRALAVYAVLQGLVFGLTYVITRIPPILRFVTPSHVRRDRVRRAALQQFLAHGLHVTAERTGVMLFAAEADHGLEVIADQGIHEKVKPDIWAEALQTLRAGLKQNRPAEGFVNAIGVVSAVLAEHFPPRANNPNEIVDKVVEI